MTRKQRAVVPDTLEVRWTTGRDLDIRSKRFKRMGALLEWLEDHPDMQKYTVILKVVAGDAR